MRGRAAGARHARARCRLRRRLRQRASRAEAAAASSASMSAPMRSRMRRRRYAAPNLAFVQASVTELPLADASVDLIVSFETIEHLAAQREMLAEFRRVLADDGVLVISSPNRPVYNEAGRRRERVPRARARSRRAEAAARRRLSRAGVVRAARRRAFGAVGGAAVGGETCGSTRCRARGLARRAAPAAPMYFVVVCAARGVALPALPSLSLFDDGELSLWRDFARAMRRERELAWDEIDARKIAEDRLSRAGRRDQRARERTGRRRARSAPSIARLQSRVRSHTLRACRGRALAQRSGGARRNASAPRVSRNVAGLVALARERDQAAAAGADPHDADRRRRTGVSRRRRNRGGVWKASSHRARAYAFELVIVNDGSPEPEIAQYAARARRTRTRDADRAASVAGLRRGDQPRVRAASRSRQGGAAIGRRGRRRLAGPARAPRRRERRRRRRHVHQRRRRRDLSAGARRQSAARRLHGGDAATRCSRSANAGSVRSASDRSRPVSVFPARVRRRRRRIRRHAARQRLRCGDRLLPARRQRRVSPSDRRRRLRRSRGPRVVRRAREAAELSARADNALYKLYPAFPRSNGEWSSGTTRREPSRAASTCCGSPGCRSRVVVFVSHPWGGGIRRYMNDLAALVAERAEVLYLEPAVDDTVKLYWPRDGESVLGLLPSPGRDAGARAMF